MTVRRLGTWLVNWYAVEEDGRWTVFDAAVPGYWPQLERDGVRPDAVEAVVLTHAHADHVGVAERLRRAGARVFVHEADRELATTAKSFGKTERTLLPYLGHTTAWRLLAHLARNGAMKPQRIGEVTTFATARCSTSPAGRGRSTRRGTRTATPRSHSTAR
jgi:glyoxylase-like metal-dependent hydrolase (beta-lactamase superfamily II)